MPTAVRTDPFGAAKFLVEIDGLAPSAFLEVSGIEAEVAVADYRNGNDAAAGARKLPGDARFRNVLLRRGLTADLSLWEWMQATLEGRVQRRNVSVTLLDEAGKPVLRFHFREAWPAKYCGPALNAEGTDVAIESLEIVHEGLSVLTSP